MQMCAEAWSIIVKSVLYYKDPISSCDAYWLWYVAPLLSLSLTHIQRSYIDSKMSPLSLSLTSWWTYWEFEKVIITERETLATGGCHWVDSGTVDWRVSQSVSYWSMWIRSSLSVGVSPSTDRLLQALLGFGPWKDSQHNNLYGRDISNKIPISSEREKEERGKKKKVRIFGKLLAIEGNLISFFPF